MKISDRIGLVVFAVGLFTIGWTVGCQGLFDEPEELMDEDLGVEEQGCEERTDCPDGHVCSEGACSDISCEEVDCEGETTCYRGVCFESCDETSDCGEEQRCLDGRCLHRDCREMACDEAEECYFGACRPGCTSAEDCLEVEDLDIDEPICDRGACGSSLCEGTDLLPDGTSCPDGEVATLSVENVGPTEATVHGALLELPEPAAIDHGFCWSTESEPAHDQGDCHSLGEPGEIGGFDHRVEELKAGHDYHVRAFVAVERTDGEEIRYADDAEELVFTTSVPPVEDVEADRGEDAEDVEVRWNHPDGWDEIEQAEGFEIIRDGQQVGDVDADATSWVDEEADEGGVPESPELTATGGDHDDRVVVSWSEPEVPDGPAHAYQVVAVVETDEAGGTSEPSVPATGYRSGYSVEDYDLDVDGELVEGWTDTEYEHTTEDGAAVPTIEPGMLSASEGTSTDYVELSLEGTELEFYEQTYRVRARNQAGPGDYSASRDGWVGAGDLEFGWEYEDGGFEELTTTAGPDYLDVSAPVDGAVRTYRAIIEADGAVESVETGTADGYRAALPVVATTGVTAVGTDSATFHAELLGEGRPVAESVGVCVATSLDPDLEDDCAAFDDFGEGQESTLEVDNSEISKLAPGTNHWVRAYAQSDEGTVYGENIGFTTGLAAPELEVSQGEHVDYVQLDWDDSDGATGYEIYRDGEYVKTTDDADHRDYDADGDEPVVPTGVEATEGAYPDRVVVTWDEVESVENPASHNYTVVATNEVAESPHSEIETGYRSGYTVEGYEVRVDGGDWEDVGDKLEYQDESAQEATLEAEGVKTTAFPQYALLELKTLATESGESSDYQVRVIYTDGPESMVGPESSPVTGNTGIAEEDIEFQWQEREGVSGDYHDIDSAGTRTYEHEGAPRADEGAWFYRVVLEVGELKEEVGGENGFRTRYVYVTDSIGDRLFKLRGDETQEWVDDELHEANILEVASDPEGNIYTGASDYTACALGEDGDERWCYEGHEDSVNGIAVDAEGNVYTGSNDGTACKLDSDGEEEWCFQGHQNDVNGVAVDAQGALYTASDDQQVCRIIDGAQDWCESRDSAVNDVAAYPDGGVVAGTDYGDICVIETDGTVEDCRGGNNPVVETIAIDDDGYIYIGTHGDEACKIDGDNMSSHEWCYDHDGYVVTVDVDPDGYMYSGSRDDSACKIDSDGDDDWCLGQGDDGGWKQGIGVYPGPWGAFPDAWDEESGGE